MGIGGFRDTVIREAMVWPRLVLVANPPIYIEDWSETGPVFNCRL